MKAHCDRGFTLIETLITAAILVTGLAACAILFSYSVATNLRNQRRTTATVLLSDKLEELRSNRVWNKGDYSEYVAVGPSGAITIVTNDSPGSYLRAWTISDTGPLRATVRVSGPDGSKQFSIRVSGTVTAAISF